MPELHLPALALYVGLTKCGFLRSPAHYHHRMAFCVNYLCMLSLLYWSLWNNGWIFPLLYTWNCFYQWCLLLCLYRIMNFYVLTKRDDIPMQKQPGCKKKRGHESTNENCDWKCWYQWRPRRWLSKYRWYDWEQMLAGWTSFDWCLWYPNRWRCTVTTTVAFSFGRPLI